MLLARLLDWLCGLFACGAQDELIVNQLIASQEKPPRF